MKKQNRGFTLIELLVVIAIIGILSAVVLASLNTARSKGSDAAIQSDIGGIRTQAQLYINAKNSYGATGSSCTALDNLFADETIAKQVAAADTANGPTLSVTCNVAADGLSYAVSAALVSAPTTYYCVDSTGTGTTTATNLTSGSTICGS
jgi:prepilin-type N-terminal cleavage/methylation domain-containing protein